jgi:hypothetical protein
MPHTWLLTGCLCLQPEPYNSNRHSHLEPLTGVTKPFAQGIAAKSPAAMILLLLQLTGSGRSHEQAVSQTWFMGVVRQ